MIAARFGEVLLARAARWRSSRQASPKSWPNRLKTKPPTGPIRWNKHGRSYKKPKSNTVRSTANWPAAFQNLGGLGQRLDGRVARALRHRGAGPASARA